MDIAQTATLIMSFTGVISLILYFPLKKREINANTENKSVKTLSEVVDNLKKELSIKDENALNDQHRICSLEEDMASLRKRITILEKKNMNNDIALNAAGLCEFYKKKKVCPILKKKEELENENK